jgi:flagellar motor component MotA
MTTTVYYIIQVLIVVFLVISFILRDTPLGFFWHLFKWLIIGLLISFGIDFVKKGAKDWWNK